MGYKNIYRYAEGFMKWEEAGLPTQKGRDLPMTTGQQDGVLPAGAFGTGLLMTLMGVFFGGIALNLTPCVYPLIPITESSFGMIKVDLTKGAAPDVTQLLNTYNVKGVPTVIFLDSRGIEQKALRTVDHIPNKEFLIKMKLAMKNESRE